MASALTKRAAKTCKWLPVNQRQWILDYEKHTGFEATELEELMAKQISFEGFAKKNIDWFENWMNDAFLAVSDIPVPEILREKV